jgi:hypothetical protein
MSDAPLPFAADDCNSHDSLVADEVCDLGIEAAEALFVEFQELMETVEGLGRGVEMIHFWHRLTRSLIDNGLDSKDLIAAVRKIGREAVKRRKIEAYAARLV